MRCIASTAPPSLDVPSSQRIVDAAAVDFTVDRCIRLHGGDNSAAFDLYDGRRHAHLVAKIYSERLAWKMAKEVLVYGLLVDVPVPTPTILFADDSRGVIDANCALMTKLDGEPSSMVTRGAGAEVIRAIFGQIGQAARACHTVSFDRFGYVGPDGLVDARASNAAYMSAQFERHLRAFRQLGGDPDVARAVERRIAGDGALFADCRQAVLCHDDLHEKNVLVAPHARGWAVTGILDVENAVAADPLLDLAKTDYYAREEAVRRAALLEGYGPLPDDAQARLALYRVHHALALWTWFARIGRVSVLPSILADVARLAHAP